MSARNRVVAGDYENKYVVKNFNNVGILIKGFETLDLTRENVSSYEVIDSKEKTSGVSAIGRAAIGGVLLGGVGLLAGLTAKKKSTHTVKITFKDNKTSLLEIDDKLYKRLMATLF